VTRIEGRLDALRNQFASTPEAIALVETLAEDLEDWHQEFLSRALSIGRNTFKPHLDADNDLWSMLRRRYGQGEGYRDEIAHQIEQWFESSKLNPVRAKIDARLEEAWRGLVLDKLVEHTALDSEPVG
jgi:Zn-finger domain-containing protein